ncbi:MAG: hypothetical protein PHY47_17600 [Lachnospiraceae bacterium]|nr:hypothetical protein [Lachnospiraceae bacterium]
MGNGKIRNKQNKWRYIVFGVILLSVIGIGASYIYQRSIYTGIPDLSNNFDSGGNYYMSVVSNSREISDKEAFAEQIVQMSRDNSFKTIKFCVEEKGYPQAMNVSVYRTSKDIEKGNPVFQFNYAPDDDNVGYDIYHNPEKYKLVIQ